jgi:hypothetical protein
MVVIYFDKIYKGVLGKPWAKKTIFDRRFWYLELTSIVVNVIGQYEDRKLCCWEMSLDKFGVCHPNPPRRGNVMSLFNYGWGIIQIENVVWKCQYLQVLLG